VQNRSVINGRAAADLAAAATELARGTAEANGAEPGVRLQGSETLIEALSSAAGVPALLEAVEADYRRRASARVTWPFLRLAGWLRPDPLRGLHLGAVEEELRRLARPALAATPAERARVDLAVHEVVAGAAEHLPTRWADAVRSAAPPPGDDLADRLDAAVRDVDLGLRTPVWWRVVFAIQMLFATAAVGGFVWLAAVGLTGWLGLPTSTPPDVGGVPLPTLLFAAGLLAGILLAAVCRLLVVSGGRRRASGGHPAARGDLGGGRTFGAGSGHRGAGRASPNARSVDRCRLRPRAAPRASPSASCWTRCWPIPVDGTPWRGSARRQRHSRARSTGGVGCTAPRSP
jgi:hypothetical protein